MPVPSSVGHDAPRQLARDRAYEAIKDAILQGVLVPGERLDDAELQRWLGMSKTPIRQALTALTREGLVETAAQSYTRVVVPRADEAVLHLQTIGVVVLGILELVVPRMGPAERDSVIRLLESVVESLRAKDAQAATAGARAYVSRLMELCPNGPLKQLAHHTLTTHTYYVLVAYSSLKPQRQDAIERYQRVLDAMRTGEIDAIEAASRPLFRLDGEPSADPRAAR
jgi:DNA-binding GntR family transcriptional regulator